MGMLSEMCWFSGMREYRVLGLLMRVAQASSLGREQAQREQIVRRLYFSR